MMSNNLATTQSRTRKILALVALSSGVSLAQKTVYEPSFLAREGSNLQDCNTPFCYDRSVQTDNWIIFWQKGFGADPSTASGTYKVNMANLKAVAEKSYSYYVDSLKMVVKGQSLTDKHKMMIFLLYQTDWAAYGSGQDEKVGTLHVDPAAANIASVVAHEIGHCFEYMTGADVPGAGWRWGFGANGAGGNGFWEQIAQWQAFNVYPEQKFRDNFAEYIASNHQPFLHETPRYANHFIGDWWAHKRGRDFMGKLWRAAKSPEDPVDTYKRLTGITQEQFNDEIFEQAARLTTWDLPSIKARGASFIDSRAQVKMSQGSDSYWSVDKAVTPENYGYNSVKLNAPANAMTVSVKFKGKAGASGYRSLNLAKAGWRYGFVALLKDGTRVYSEMATAKYANGTNPEGSLAFPVPANCSKLWLVVTGAPQEHWHHAWDDNDDNDEQWPYAVQLGNTNLLGQPNPPLSSVSVAPVAERAFEVRQGALHPAPGVVALEIRTTDGRLLASSPVATSLASLPKGLLLVATRNAGSERWSQGTLLNR